MLMAVIAGALLVGLLLVVPGVFLYWLNPGWEERDIEHNEILGMDPKKDPE